MNECSQISPERCGRKHSGCKASLQATKSIVGLFHAILRFVNECWLVRTTWRIVGPRSLTWRTVIAKPSCRRRWGRRSSRKRKEEMGYRLCSRDSFFGCCRVEGTCVICLWHSPQANHDCNAVLNWKPDWWFLASECFRLIGQLVIWCRFKNLSARLLTKRLILPTAQEFLSEQGYKSFFQKHATRIALGHLEAFCQELGTVNSPSHAWARSNSMKKQTTFSITLWLPLSWIWDGSWIFMF